jgi:cell division septation protein DedD
VAQTQTQQPTTPIVSGNGKYQLVDGTPLKMYSVACGAFGSLANAQNLFRELSQYGYAATIVLDLSKNMYRVLAMTSDNRADADQAKASLAEKYPTAWILINK